MTTMSNCLESRAFSSQPRHCTSACQHMDRYRILCIHSACGSGMERKKFASEKKRCFGLLFSFLCHILIVRRMYIGQVGVLKSFCAIEREGTILCIAEFYVPSSCCPVENVDLSLSIFLDGRTYRGQRT